MKQVFIKQGQAVVDIVPAPTVTADTILVAVDHSCVSIGTESAGLETSAEPLWMRAIKNPMKVPKAFKMLIDRGFAYTADVVAQKSVLGTAVGYSLAGTVIQVGEEVNNFQVGDRVACAGAQTAHHAEIIRAYPNLTVKIPDPVNFDEASTVALGSIALQGVRRTNPTLGETFVVIGLGFIGQLTVQMLKANGCHVIGTDLDEERVQMALDLGMDEALYVNEDSVKKCLQLTHGLGADGVIVTASSKSDEVISLAFQMCRRKGRVTLVGDVGLQLQRQDFYRKELDFFISTSYGPGRYDANYEEKGLDYPVAYVRWTENRNMQAYLQLIANKQLNLKPLIKHIYAVDKATDAYNAIQAQDNRILLLLLSYPDSMTEDAQKSVIKHNDNLVKDRIRLAIVGAGSFAQGVHLPNLKKLNDHYHLQSVVNRSGHTAIGVAKRYDINYTTTDYNEVLQDDAIDAVLISTRHNLHGEQVLQALQANKHVFVEKPLVLTQEELDAIRQFYDESDKQPVLLTGYNRRFSPYLRKIKSLIEHRTSPLMITYRMNAGHIPLDSWIQGEEGGGRNLGEACHIYDLFVYLTEKRAVDIQALSIRMDDGYYTNRDNFSVTMRFEDGSVATLLYTSKGARDLPKEYMEVYADGQVLVMDDYKALRMYGSQEPEFTTPEVDKGHLQELEAFAQALNKGGAWPISLWEQLHTMEIALTVENELRK
ncbi:MAG: bi-domain-containing oxidoreductase [Phototrophicaceae bacterium]